MRLFADEPAINVRTMNVPTQDEPVELGRFHLTPRQDTGSGMINDYEILTAAGDCTTAEYTLQKSGTLPFENRTEDRVIALDAPVTANCVQVVWNSSWGGDGTEQATATLAEFNADTGFEESGVAETPNPSSLTCLTAPSS